MIIKRKPLIKARVLRTVIITPKKPNSAKRKVAKVYIKGLGRVFAYIPGEKNTLKSSDEVMIRKGKIQDLVNVNFFIIRGLLDSDSPSRSSSRSKFTIKNKSKK